MHLINNDFLKQQANIKANRQCFGIIITSFSRQSEQINLKITFLESNKKRAIWLAYYFALKYSLEELVNLHCKLLLS